MIHTKTSDASYKLFFGTLNNKNRINIINVLRKGQKCVSEICRALRFNQTTVSHNLKRLQHCGFVFAERRGKYIYYTINSRTIKPLMGMIDRHMSRYCKKIVLGDEPAHKR